MKNKRTKGIIIYALFLVICFIFNAHSQSVDSSLEKGNPLVTQGTKTDVETIEDSIEQTDDWRIVIDPQSIRVEEKEKNILFTTYPEINPKKNKADKIIVKTSNSNSKNTTVPSKKDSISTLANQQISDKTTTPKDTLNNDVIQDLNNGSKTINYDNSRTINIDNNRDVNKGTHMNKNRDRDRDLRRDLKRDMKRDKNRDRNKARRGNEITRNRFKLKIIY